MTAVQPRFDPVVHMPPRLQVYGLLTAVDDMDFAAVRDQIGVSDGRSAFDAHVAELRRITGA